MRSALSIGVVLGLCLGVSVAAHFHVSPDLIAVGLAVAAILIGGAFAAVPTPKDHNHAD